MKRWGHSERAVTRHDSKVTRVPGSHQTRHNSDVGMSSVIVTSEQKLTRAALHNTPHTIRHAAAGYRVTCCNQLVLYTINR